MAKKKTAATSTFAVQLSGEEHEVDHLEWMMRCTRLEYQHKIWETNGRPTRAFMVDLASEMESLGVPDCPPSLAFRAYHEATAPQCVTPQEEIGEGGFPNYEEKHAHKIIFGKTALDLMMAKLAMEEVENEYTDRYAMLCDPEFPSKIRQALIGEGAPRNMTLVTAMEGWIRAHHKTYFFQRSFGGRPI